MQKEKVFENIFKYLEGGNKVALHLDNAKMEANIVFSIDDVIYYDVDLLYISLGDYSDLKFYINDVEVIEEEDEYGRGYIIKLDANTSLYMMGAA